MPTSPPASHDDLIAHLIAALHASQSLHMGAVEKLVRMSLIELGQSIARTQTQKPRKKASTPRKKPASAARELALVIESEPEAPMPRRTDPAIWQRRPDAPPIPRRRLPPRRSGSRG